MPQDHRGGGRGGLARRDHRQTLLLSRRSRHAYKPLIYEIASGVVRWKLYLDWVLSHFVKEGLKKDVRHLLWMSLYQVFFMKKAAYHVVNEAVDHAKKEKGQARGEFRQRRAQTGDQGKRRAADAADPVSRLSIVAQLSPLARPEMVRQVRRRRDGRTSSAS